MNSYIRFFENIDHKQNKEVGGKNASLGEMFKELSAKGINIPDGFATTAEAFWHFIEENNLKEPIQEQLSKLDKKNFENLKEIGKSIRQEIMKADMPNDLANEIKDAYKKLQDKEKDMESVAVRSSATAEDLPEASFAGQHESFLNIKGEKEVVKAVQECYASLYTDRAIKYREDNEFEHMKVALSAGVQRMVRSDKASAGVCFTIAPESGFDQVIYITGAWGLGENVVQGQVISDEFYVFKPNLENEHAAILTKKLGSKNKTMVYSGGSKGNGASTKNKNTPKEKQHQFVLNDEEINTIAQWSYEIEKHYEKPMDIEWAKDGNSGELYIVQARPETVHSSKKGVRQLKQYSLKDKGREIVKGNGIGDKIAAGKARILNSPEESDKLEEGDVLVTEITNPDWDPIMKKASAVVTNSGGRTSHAAIVARELGTVAAVGAEQATEKIKDGQEITVSCAEGKDGIIYEGILDWEEDEIDMEKIGNPDTEVMLILANPGMAFQYAQYPTDGVGLMRLEFVINNSIKIHPLALVHFDELEDKKAKKEIEELTQNYENKEQYFIDHLAQAVGTIAAAFHDRDVIVRMSDFKSNEYANLVGGQEFEPAEENPMVGFRGASRYYSEEYKEGFRLECEAMKKVREEMGLSNVKLMVPFCRTVEEAHKVVDLMAKMGLKRGENELEIYMMTEIPSNVILADQFAEAFDGFSIGSNDLTQLTLGVDRDSELVSGIFQEKNDAVKEMISMVIEKARDSKTKIGLCGQAPSDFPEFAQFLVEKKINSISFNPDALSKGIKNILEAEGKKN